MVYRNTKTGMKVETSCVISGKDWEAVQTVQPPAPEEEEKPKKRVRKKDNE